MNLQSTISIYGEGPDQDAILKLANAAVLLDQEAKQKKPIQKPKLDWKKLRKAAKAVMKALAFVFLGFLFSKRSA